MSNLKHGFYSKNPSINPDSVMLNNALIKKRILNHQKDIRDVVSGKIVGVGITDLVVRLIDYALPHHEELMPKSELDNVWTYYRSDVFAVIRNSIEERSLESLIAATQMY